MEPVGTDRRVVASVASGQGAKDPSPPISDNSFLIEEAYNQESRVVQHISAFQRNWGAAEWAYSFVQEWPLGGQHHQLSFTLPVLRAAGQPGGIGIGDVLLNYRLQVVGSDRLSIAPRLSFLLPTGSREKGFGSGSAGLEFNLPISASLAPAVVTHWNAGMSLVPSAVNAGGARATTTRFNLGGSAVWLLRPNVNFLLETVWVRAQSVVGPGLTITTDSWLLNPGIRWAHNFRSGLQIVPGIAFPIGIGPSSNISGLFLYLSFEHPF